MPAAKASTAKKAPAETPEPAPKPKAKPKGRGTVVHTLTHRGEIIEPGSPVPEDLSDEDIEVLVRQGHVEV